MTHTPLHSSPFAPARRRSHLCPPLPLTLLLILPLLMLIAGCSSSKKASVSSRPKTPQTVSTRSMTPTERTLVTEAQQWLGTPYKYGGNTRKGVDCSGLVYHVYRNSLDISLPRNSAKQHEFCTKVKRGDLATGDLVFFATTKGSRRVSHVGLYVGDGKMIHASTRRGVMVQDLEDQYYRNAYVGAGRVSEFASRNKASKKSKSSKDPKSSATSKPTKKSKPSKTSSQSGATKPSTDTKPAVPATPKPSAPLPAPQEQPVQQLPAPIAPSEPVPASPSETAPAVEPVAPHEEPYDSPFYEFEEQPDFEPEENPADVPSEAPGATAAPMTAAASPTSSAASEAPADSAPAAVKINVAVPAKVGTQTKSGGDSRAQVLSNLPDLH